MVLSKQKQTVYFWGWRRIKTPVSKQKITILSFLLFSCIQSNHFLKRKFTTKMWMIWIQVTRSAKHHHKYNSSLKVKRKGLVAHFPDFSTNGTCGSCAQCSVWIGCQKASFHCQGHCPLTFQTFLNFTGICKWYQVGTVVLVSQKHSCKFNLVPNSRLEQNTS